MEDNNDDMKRPTLPPGNDDDNFGPPPRKRPRVTPREEQETDKGNKDKRLEQVGIDILTEFRSWLREEKEEQSSASAPPASSGREEDNMIPEKFRSNATVIDFVKNKVSPAAAFSFATESLRNDKDFALQAVSECPDNLALAPAALQNDPLVVLTAVQRGGKFKYCRKPWYGKLMQFASAQLLTDKEFCKQVLEANAAELQVLPPELRDDPDIVLHAIKYGDGQVYYLQFASERLRSDKAFIRQLMTIDSMAFCHVTKDLLTNDRDFTLELLSMDDSFDLLNFLDENNEIEEYLTRELALKLVQVKGGALSYFPDKWKADREIVLASLPTCPYSFNDASEELKADQEVVLEAIQISGETYEYASEALKADRDILLEALRRDVGMYQYAPDELKEDREILLEALRLGGSIVLAMAPRHVWRDIELVRAAVQNDRFLLYREFADERTIVLEAAKCHPHVLQQASERLRADPEIVLQAVKFDASALGNAHADLRSNREVLLAAVKQDGYLLQLAADDLKMDIELVMLAVRNDNRAMQYVNDTVRCHPRVVGAYIRSTVYSAIYFPREVVPPLVSACSAIEQQHKWDGCLSFPIAFRDEPGEEEGSAVRRYVEHQWKRGLHHKTWLLKQRLDDPGVVRLILEYGVKKEFQDAQEVVRLAPIFAAFADRGINWNGIPLLVGYSLMRY